MSPMCAWPRMTPSLTTEDTSTAVCPPVINFVHRRYLSVQFTEVDCRRVANQKAGKRHMLNIPGDAGSDPPGGCLPRVYPGHTHTYTTTPVHINY